MCLKQEEYALVYQHALTKVARCDDFVLLVIVGKMPNLADYAKQSVHLDTGAIL